MFKEFTCLFEEHQVPDNDSIVGFIHRVNCHTHWCNVLYWLRQMHSSPWLCYVKLQYYTRTMVSNIMFYYFDTCSFPLDCIVLYSGRTNLLYVIRHDLWFYWTIYHYFVMYINVCKCIYVYITNKWLTTPLSPEEETTCGMSKCPYTFLWTFM